MAKDYLAVPASSTDSERVFSIARLIGTDSRNRLHSANFESLQVLRSVYLHGVIPENDILKKRKVLNSQNRN
jgi:hypothetical protein